MSQRLNAYFAATQEMRGLALKARQLAQLQERYRQAVPPSLGRASRALGLEQGILTLGADNSAIAAKLRQFAPQLIQTLTVGGAEVTGIQVRVQVALPPAAPAKGNPALGTSARQRVSELAATLPDSPLKSALEKLARNRRGPASEK